MENILKTGELELENSLSVDINCKKPNDSDFDAEKEKSDFEKLLFTRSYITFLKKTVSTLNVELGMANSYIEELKEITITEPSTQMGDCKDKMKLKNEELAVIQDKLKALKSGNFVTREKYNELKQENRELQRVLHNYMAAKYE